MKEFKRHETHTEKGQHMYRVPKREKRKIYILKVKIRVIILEGNIPVSEKII